MEEGRKSKEEGKLRKGKKGKEKGEKESGNYGTTLSKLVEESELACSSEVSRTFPTASPE